MDGPKIILTSNLFPSFEVTAEEGRPYKISYTLRDYMVLDYKAEYTDVKEEL